VSTAPLVDCDVHTPVPTLAALAPWLPAHWQESTTLSGFSVSGAVARSYPAQVWGDLPQTVGADAAQARAAVRAHLDRGGSRYAILNCCWGLEALKHPDLAAELARAVNQWLQAEWLAHDERFRASLVVTPNDALAAAREIERAAGDPGFVQVLLPARAEQPYGNRRYFPLHEAAAAHGLPVAVHFGGMPGTPPTPSGWSAYYLEDYVGMAQVFQTQVTSLIAEGTLARFPGLRVVLCEAGFSWIPPLLWRLDKEWKGLRREVPWVAEPPSAYFRRHFRGTLQPIDAPADERLLGQLLTQIGSEDYLLYATDFPHRHVNNAMGFLARLPAALRDAVAAGNALDLYGLSPRTSAASSAPAGRSG
jgi:predicted TIM-barrel fold metal-dependent hydrolase